MTGFSAYNIYQDGLGQMSVRIRVRNILMVLAGVAGLLLKSWFAESLGDFAFSYLGNLSISFAVYFIVSIAASPKLNRLMISISGLLIVEIFELTDGFGVMTNVYDPFDYFANALGVALAYGVDVVSTHLLRARSDNQDRGDAA